MLVFRYDKSFDGLLSALFDAYAMRAFPEQLIGPGEPEPLFTERVHEVATDPAHAARVWRGLERRLVVRARSMLVYAWHGEQERSDLLMLRCMRRVFDEGGGVLADQADPDMKALHRLALKVSHECERLRQFVRLQKAADGTYFAAATPEHDALPLSLDYFTDRFADQRWLIYDRRRDYGYYYDGRTARRVTLEDDRGMIADKLADRSFAQRGPRAGCEAVQADRVDHHRPRRRGVARVAMVSARQPVGLLVAYPGVACLPGRENVQFRGRQTGLRTILVVLVRPYAPFDPRV